MTTQYVGRKLNIVFHQGTAKEVKEVDNIVTQLKKGIVRTESGKEFHVDELYNRGKGLFVNAKGSPKKTTATQAPVKPAATPVKAAPAGRAPAAAVTATELEGKKVDGSPVSKILRQKGVVILESGARLELANIVRRGKGYVSTDAAPVRETAPAPKGGAVPKTVKTGAQKKTGTAAALIREPEEELTTKDVRHQTINIDGEEEVIATTFKSGKCVTESGTEFHVSDIRLDLNDGYCLFSAEYIEELEAMHAAASKPAKVKPITGRELKGQVVMVGKIKHHITRSLKSGNVVSDHGFTFPVSEVARDGSGFVYTGKNAPKVGQALPVNRAAPTPEKRALDVEAFDYDTALNIKDFLATAIVQALKGVYNVSLATSVATVNKGNMLNVTFALASTNASPADIKQKVETLLKGFAAAQAEQGGDFSRSELEEEEREEEEEEEREEEEEVEDEEEEEREEEEEVEDEEEEVEDEEEEETEEEEEDEADEFGNDSDDAPADFENEDEAEVSFPADTTAIVAGGVARLAKLVPGANVAFYVKQWYESQDVYDAVGYDIEPGMTLQMGGKECVLVGLGKDGLPLVLALDTKGRRPGVTLETLKAAL